MLDRVSSAKTGSIAGILLITLSMLPMLQGALITPLLAVIRESAGDGHDSTFLLRLMMVAPALAMIFLIPLIGRFSDRFERGHILVLGLALYGACGLAAFLSPSIEWILASRFLLGAALAIIMTITTASTGDIFAPPERNHVLGLQYLASTGIGMTAPALAGCVALIDWRLNFIVYLVALLLIAPTRALQRHPAVDRRLADPTPTRLEAGPVVGIFALAAVGTTVLWLLTLQFAFHLAEIGYASPVVAGLGLGAPCLAGMASGAIYPILTRYLSLRQTAALAFALMGLGYAVISFTVSLPALGIGLLLAGFGFGFNQPNCVAWLLSRASPEARGRAAAGLTFAICLGQLVSPFLYDPLVSVLGSRATFGVVAGACMLVALAASSASSSPRC